MKVKDIIKRDRLVDLFFSRSEVVNKTESDNLKTGIYSTNFDKLIDAILEEGTDRFYGGKITCDLCGNEWVGIIYIETEKLECPNCGNMVNYTFKT